MEFAPCEKGEFRETTYQETFVFDIVQTDDGRRHSIMKGDKVLAPTDIGSELYAPGTVIDGQESREQSKGGYIDIQCSIHTPRAKNQGIQISMFCACHINTRNLIRVHLSSTVNFKIERHRALQSDLNNYTFTTAKKKT